MVELNVKLYSAYPKEIMLWDHSYSVFKNELPNLYREVTKNVATKIGEALLPETEKHLAPKRIPKPGAYEAYLKGMYYTGFLNQEGFDLARKQFNKSIEIDSLFGQAYQGLATLIASQKQMGFIPSLPYQPLLDSLTDLSYLLDSTNAEVLMGVAAHNTWGVFNKWKKAEKYYRKSIEYNPNMTMTRITYAHFLMIQNRWDEAWNQMNYALELDPENPWVLAFSAAMFATEGKVLSAAKKAERLIRIAPKHPMAEGMLLNKYIALKQESEAVKQLIKLVSIHGAPKTADIAMEGFAHGGFQGALEELLPYLESYSKDHFIRSWLMFNLYGYIGKKEKQEDWIIRMYENQDPNLPYLGIRKIKLDSEVRTMVMKEIGLW
ncbi:MAG: hypothetical protein RLO81_00740 [Fulvivirga sp.]|uniref:hypothetical protein n=1 Tax=Fulvivirga sp. TaxID=1931237 RepID=UPI0032EBD1AF